MNSTYVTFGEFNKPQEPPPPPPQSQMNDPYNMGSYDQESFTQAPSPQSVRYPIRQHMTQPRNPYTPQMLPPYPRSDMPGSGYYNSSSSSPLMMPPPPPPPLRMPLPRNSMTTPPSGHVDFDTPSNATPIGMAFSSESFDMPEKESFQQNSPSRLTKILDATCVDINDHIVNCPICSKYYQNHTTVYVGIIILLGFIILIFLLKSIMEVRR